MHNDALEVMAVTEEVDKSTLHNVASMIKYAARWFDDNGDDGTGIEEPVYKQYTNEY